MPIEILWINTAVFSGGIFYYLVVHLIYKKTIIYHQKKNNPLALWHGWLIAATLRISGLLGGYLLIGLSANLSGMNQKFTTQMILLYSLPLFLGILFDLRKALLKEAAL